MFAYFANFLHQTNSIHFQHYASKTHKIFLFTSNLFTDLMRNVNELDDLNNKLFKAFIFPNENVFAQNVYIKPIQITSKSKYFIKFNIVCTPKNFFIVSKSNPWDFRLQCFHSVVFFYPINKTFFLLQWKCVLCHLICCEFCWEFLFAFSAVKLTKGIKWNTFVNLNEKGDVILCS